MVFTEGWVRSKVRISERNGFRIDNHLLHYCVVHRAEFPSAVRRTVSTAHQLLNHQTDVKQGVAVARWYILQWAKNLKQEGISVECEAPTFQSVRGEGPCVVRSNKTRLNMSGGGVPVWWGLSEQVWTCPWPGLGGFHVICGWPMASWVVVTWGPPTSLCTDITEITFHNFTGGR